MRVDFNVHRKADLQRVCRELLWIERNPDRNALNDLDPIPRGVLRRQQRKRRSRARAESRYFPVVLDLAAIKVRRQRDGLTDAHRRQLRLFEIRVDPHLVERNDRHQRRPRTDPLSELHGTLGDESGYRCRQHRSRISQVRIAHVGRCVTYVRMIFGRCPIDACTIGRELLLRSDQRRFGAVESLRAARGASDRR